MKQYPDDTHIFHTSQNNRLRKWSELFQNFQVYRVLKLITAKLKSFQKKIVWIKKSDCIFITLPALEWTSEPTKVLGITLTQHITRIVERNIKTLIKKMKNLIKIWPQRKLTLFEKVVAIISLLEYRLSTLPTPSSDMLKTLDKILYNFLWDNKPYKIAKKMTIRSANDRHCNKKHMTLKIIWIKRIMNEIDDIFNYLNYYAKTNIKFLIKCNMSAEDIRQCWKKPNILVGCSKTVVPLWFYSN